MDRLPDIAVYDSSFEAVANIDTAMREHLDAETPYFLVGGIATAALMHPATTIHPEERCIIAAAQVDIPTRRPNGTVRDADILVGASVAPAKLSQAKKTLEADVFKGSLEASVFGFDPYEVHAAQKGGWVSRRLYRNADDSHYYQLGPVVQRVKPESYEPWKLILPRELGSIAVLHPVAQMLAYEMRSIGGLRPKDQAKCAQMQGNILQYPAMQQDLRTTFREWGLFADTLKNIRDHKAVQPEVLQPGTTSRDLAVMRWRGRLLGMLEKHTKIVDLAQKPLPQKVLNIFVRAAE